MLESAPPRSRPTFHPRSAFEGQAGKYRLLPFRFQRIPGVAGKVLLTSDTGEHLFIPNDALQPLVRGELAAEHPSYLDLIARHFIAEGELATTLRVLASQYRTKKSFLFEGPSLFLFVVTLRCDHSCHYCQVSRQSPDASAFDMGAETARAAVDRLFEAPSPRITVEFQGGEPLLAFGRIKEIVELIERRTPGSGKQIQFAITTTLHLADDETLAFLRDHRFAVSTSLDGPAHLHDAHRPNRTRDSFARTIASINRARAVLGSDQVTALVTLTRSALGFPREIVDTYVEHGFRSIFLRPLSPFGFAARSERRIGYPTSDFVAFYEAALDHILALNKQGVAISESYAGLLLTHILTPFPTGYVDLRSPAGAGLGALVFNYDGGVYPSDEARMLVEMGDSSLRFGHVTDPYDSYFESDVMALLLGSGLAESLPGCSDCAFVPYCGADPVSMISRTGRPIGHTYASAHCIRHMGVFNILFRLLEKGDPDSMRTFAQWLTPAGGSG